MQQSNEIKQINITEIKPNRFQPRIKFDEKALQELANSIKKYGIIEPLILRKIPNGYEVIAGERRLKAASLVGLTQVPAIIMEINDQASAELAIVENLQRQSLTPIEEAKAYQNLAENSNSKEIADLMSKEEKEINNKMKLLKLSKNVQEALQNNEISEGHAKALLQLENEQEENAMLERIKKERLTVKQVQEIIKENKEKVEEIDINPNMQKVLSGLDIVNKKSNTFDDVEPEIVEDKMDKTQMINIDAIKASAQDINHEEQTADINDLLKVDESIPKQEQPAEKPKFSFAGKFFTSLEDESTNMNTGSNFMEPAKNVEMPLPMQPQTPPPQPINIERINMPDTVNNEQTPEVTSQTINPTPIFNMPELNKAPVEPTQNSSVPNNFQNQPGQINIQGTREMPQGEFNVATPTEFHQEPNFNNPINTWEMPTQETMASNITPMPTFSSENTMPLPNLNTVPNLNPIPIPNNIPSVQTPKIEPTIPNANLEPNQNIAATKENISNNITPQFIPQEAIVNNIQPVATQQNIVAPTQPLQQNNNQTFTPSSVEMQQNIQQSTTEEPFLPEFNAEKTPSFEEHPQAEIPQNNNTVDTQPQAKQGYSPYYLRNALNMGRQLIDNLEASGYIVDVDELDLPNEYQFIIKIQKNNKQNNWMN